MAWTSPRTWVTGELVTAALLNTHLRDNLNAVWPWEINLLGLSGTSNTNFSTNSFASDNPYIASTSAQNAYVEWQVALSAGTWSVFLNHYKGSDRGIYTVAIAGSTAGTIDGYNASSTSAVGSITGISVAATGVQAIRFTMATKNASSSSYFGAIFGVQLLRTA